MRRIDYLVNVGGLKKHAYGVEYRFRNRKYRIYRYRRIFLRRLSRKMRLFRDRGSASNGARGDIELTAAPIIIRVLII
jgi:hypothetical protein